MKEHALDPMFLPPEARWLVRERDSRIRHFVIRACRDFGLIETNTNRSGVIDEYNKRAGVAVGSFWCASAWGAWMRDSGLVVPVGYASCDVVLEWGLQTNRFVPVGGRVDVGYAVLYGKAKWNKTRSRPSWFDAQHIGGIIRADGPYPISAEGNTILDKAGNFRLARNGNAVAPKWVTPDDPVIGFLSPFPLINN